MRLVNLAFETMLRLDRDLDVRDIAKYVGVVLNVNDKAVDTL